MRQRMTRVRFRRQESMSFCRRQMWKSYLRKKEHRMLLRKEKLMKKKFNTLEDAKKQRRTRFAMLTYSCLVLSLTVGAATAYATGDPITVINNLSTFIFSLIRAIGLILLGLGIMQVGLSLKSHDPSQRANGFLTVAGGVVITFTKEILNTIVG